MKSHILARHLDRRSVSIALRAPVILMVLAATAIPIELRHSGQVSLSFGFATFDAFANVVGYVPVGLVLGGIGWVPAVIVAAMVSTFAEACQIAFAHRDPQVLDVAANVIGAVIGIAAGAHWKIQSPEIRVTGRRAIVAALAVVAVIAGIWVTSGDPLNPRGVSSPGILEADWKRDERSGQTGLGRSTSLRLTGSMTISAWVNATAFPHDDTAIVSSLTNNGDTTGGYQLDTTVDTGPRTIGFKLGDACGQLMTRYGATPLVVGVRYHVAGIYDAQAKTLDVYLNGQLDNGFLVGSVSGAQRSSRSPVYVGRRGDSRGAEFAGSIDEVRIYSRALTKAEVVRDMRGPVVEGESSPPAATAVENVESAGRDGVQRPACAVSSDDEDAEAVPIAAGAIGVLAAAACLGLWPSAGRPLGAVVSIAAGLLLLPVTSPTLPALNIWLIPLTSLAGAASVVASLKRRTAD